jgi:acetylornithine deacetylase/succinyl-diaminopimelate desuccinylase-like protein
VIAHEARPVAFGRDELDWLLELLATPSVSPLEGGAPAATADAQRVVAEGARARGFSVALFEPPPPEVLAASLVPVSVLACAREHGDDFLAQQPCLVLRYGSEQPAERRLTLNFHVDTVAPHIPPTVREGRIQGRGAIDSKGPGIAALLGIAAAFRDEPALADEIEVLVMSVPGEEGGAMGSYGTRWLLDRGLAGRLNVFAEPTDLKALDRATASMTPRFSVRGRDATDDEPELGHNATLALGHVALELVRRLAGPVADAGGKLCVGGLATGDSHNRVFGSGTLLVNVAYADEEAGRRLAELVDEAFVAAGDSFAAAFADEPLAAALVADWKDVVRLDWLKRGLPCLSNRDPELEALLARCGIERAGPDDVAPFTCDAIWAQGRPGYHVVFGPGSLGRCGAHTAEEYADVADLERYAGLVARVVRGLAAAVAA